MRKVTYEPVEMFPRRPPREGAGARGLPGPGWPVIGILLIVGFWFVTFARAFLMPVTLAILLYFVFVPARRAMARIGIGPAGSAGIISIGILLALGVLGYLAYAPISQVMENAPAISQRMEERYREIRASFHGIEEAAAKIDEVTGGSDEPAAAAGPAAVVNAGDATTVVAAPGGGEEVTVAVTTAADSNGPGMLQRLVAVAPSLGSQIMFTLVLLYFMLASGDLLYLKIVQSFDTSRDKRQAYNALREIERSLGNYLGAITLINVGLGLAIGLAMWAWGMPSPLLFGLAGFVLNYIPYIGALAGTAVSILVALFVFEDLWTPLIVGLTFMALTSLEGQFVTPYFVSRRLSLNEVVVFVTVALWAWLWSVIGMVVAVPTLVVLRVLADHIPSLQKFGNFLSADTPELEDEEEDEAREIVATGDEAKTPEEARELIEEIEPRDEPAPAGPAAPVA